VRRLSGKLSTTIPTRPDPTTGETKPVDADDTCLLMLELADGTPVQVRLSAVTYQGRGHWLEIYGDQGTLILGSDNQSDYVHGFKLWASQKGAPLSEVAIPERLAFAKTYPDGRLAPFVRVVDRWVESIERQEMLDPSLREGIYSQQLMDLTQQSAQIRAWVEVSPLEKLFLQNRNAKN
jgi:predicted dehydrogenase